MTIIDHDELVETIFGKREKKPRLATVIKALERLGIPYERGVNRVFTTEEALNIKIMGRTVAPSKADTEKIEFL